MGVAVDAAGDLFIADTANCRVRVCPAADGTLFGQAVTRRRTSPPSPAPGCAGAPGRAARCGGAAVEPGRGGARLRRRPPRGRQRATSRCCWPRPRGGTFYGTAVAAGDIGVVVGGTGSYGPYIADGLPANGPTAELNDPRGLAVGPTGALFVTDGFMHVIRVVPAVDETLFGPGDEGRATSTRWRAPCRSRPPAGANDGTRWVRHARWARRSAWRSRRRARCTTPTPPRTWSRVIGVGSGVLVSRFGRRTFLASAAASPPARPPPGHRCHWRAAADVSARPSAPPSGRRRCGDPRPLRCEPGLTVNGLRTRWGSTPTTARSPGRCRRRAAGATQNGLPDRGAAHRPRPRRAGLGQRPSGLGPAGLRRLRRAGLAADAALPLDRAGPGRRGAGGGPSRLRPVHHRAARRRTGRRSWLKPAGGSPQPDRVTYLRTEVTPPAGIARAAPRLRLGRAHLPPLSSTARGRRLAELLLPRRAVRPRRRPHPALQAGRPAPLGVLHRWYGRGRAAPPPPRACSSSSRSGTPTARHVVYGTDGSWRELPAEWLPRPSATPTGATSSNGSTGAPTPEGGRARLRRRCLVARPRSSARPAPRPSPHRTRSAPPSTRRRCRPSACTRWPAAPSWRTSAPFTRRARW